MSAGKLGRKLGKSSISGHLLLEAIMVDPFPVISPYSTFDGRVGLTSMPDLGNMQYGCCVWVDYVYTRMLNAWMAGTQPVGNFTDYTVWPTKAQTLTSYFTYQGSPRPGDFVWSEANGYDNGADEGEALLWHTKHSIGPLGPAAAFAELPPGGPIYQGAMATFGVVTDDIVVFDEMMDEFNAGQPWSATAGTVAGGHSTASVYRDPLEGMTATWTKFWPFTWPNRRATLEQAWLILDEDQLKAQKFFNGAKLQADIKALQGSPS